MSSPASATPSRPESGLRLGVARVALGLVFLVRTTPVLAPLGISYLGETWPLLGWPTDAWTVPSFGVHLPAGAVAALCVVRTVAAITFTLGLFSRASGVAAGVAGYAVLSMDAFSVVFSLRLLFLSAVVLGLSDAGTTLAIRPDRSLSPATGRLLIVWFVASVYLWSGLAKIRGDWLHGDTLALFHADGLLAGKLADRVLAMAPGRIAASWGVMLVELALGPLLVFHRTRRAAVFAALGFHVVLEVVAHPDVFGWIMTALLVGIA